jgi:polynucleotide 5'-kinase involved in rRNA processing
VQAAESREQRAENREQRAEVYLEQHRVANLEARQVVKGTGRE